MKKVNDSFIAYASDILGDTAKGLTGSQIIKECNYYAVEFDVETPITSSDFGNFGSRIKKKSMALHQNLQKFNSEQRYTIIKELCELELFEENPEVQKLKSQLNKRYGDFNTEIDSKVLVNTDIPTYSIDDIEDKPTVFISYNQNDSNFADEIESSISKSVQVKRDKHGIENWGSITEFMTTIRDQDFAVLIISPEYLQSTSCLFEVIQLMKEQKWIEKTMFVVLDGFDIYGTVERATYIRYWDKKCEEIEESINDLPREKSIWMSEELRKAKIISLHIDEFLKTVSDELNPKYSEAIKAIIDKVS